MHRYKLFIFDLDDTLFDYKATEKNAVAEACKSVGIQFTDLIYREYKRANDKAKNLFLNILIAWNTFVKLGHVTFWKCKG